MIYRIAADLLVLIHFAFILFVVAGGFLAVKWNRLVLLHIPAVTWGVLIEFYGWICPLTPLENELRMDGGGIGFSGGFIEKYIVAVIYPEGLTREIQLLLGIMVIVINLIVYGYLLWQRKEKLQNT